LAQEANLHIGDTGTPIIAHFLKEDSTDLDISGASLCEIHFLKPDKTAITKAAMCYTDGTDGKAVYYTEADFLDQAGVMKVQGHVTFPDGKNWRTEVAWKTVDANLVEL